MNVFQNLMISRPYKEEKITINEKLLEIYKKRASQRTNTENEILYNIFEVLGVSNNVNLQVFTKKRC